MPINYMYSKIFPLFLLFSFVAILSCNDGAIIHRKHVKENEEVGSFVENQQVPKLDVQKLDSGINTIKVALNTLSKGVYLARININNRVFVRKVIIE